VFHRFYLNLKL